MMSESKRGPYFLPVTHDTIDHVPRLALKDASEFLGVHYSTLRKWADRGEIPVFRTPGGHRRFSIVDLRRFLEERMGNHAPPDTDAFINVAIGRVRAEIQKMPEEQSDWRYQLDERGSDIRRQRGRQLFALAIGYVLKPKRREWLLSQGRQLGYDYGKEAVSSQVSLRDTGKAVQFFRNQLNDVLHHAENVQYLDAEDIHMRGLLDHFLDEVLYAVLDGYEQNLGGGGKDVECDSP